jgi:hypothetical protein
MFESAVQPPLVIRHDAGNQVLDIAQMRSSIGRMGKRRALERPRWSDRSTSDGATGGATQIVQQSFPHITAAQGALELPVQGLGDGGGLWSGWL